MKKRLVIAILFMLIVSFSLANAQTGEDDAVAAEEDMQADEAGPEMYEEPQELSDPEAETAAGQLKGELELNSWIISRNVNIKQILPCLEFDDSFITTFCKP